MKLTPVLVLLLIALASFATCNNLRKDPVQLFKKADSQDFVGTYITTACDKTAKGYKGTLVYNGPLNTYLSDENPVLKNLNFYITLDSNNEVTFKVYPSDTPYFQIPYNKPFAYDKQSNSEYNANDSVYYVEEPKVGKPLHFAVRTPQGITVYDTTGTQFIFSQLYVQIGTEVYGEDIWGWGERRGMWTYKSGQYTIWNYDNPVCMSSGEPGQQTYGTHPTWLQRSNKNAFQQEKPNQYHMVHLRTTYGLQMDYDKYNRIVLKMSGGPIELKFFIYDTPVKNIEAYNKYINGWDMHPFWSMGFHICRWGLPTSTEWADMWYKANENKVNFDIIWSDIDYMQEYEDFTISDKYDTNVMKKVTDLNDPLGVNWVPIIDAGVKYSGDSGEKGKKLNLFIKSATTGKALIGCVWPGAAHFVDFNNPKSEDFWIQGLKNITEVYNAPQPSGIWLDMNDPSSFTTNEEGEVLDPSECKPLDSQADNQEALQLVQKFNKAVKVFTRKLGQILMKNLKKGSWGYPWSPMGNLPLAFKTLSTKAIHINGKDARYFKQNDFEITEYELHNLYAFFEGIDTNAYLKQSGFDLPFIITRSSFVGQGAYTQHWTGDNFASWDQLQTSLGDIFNFQIFGIPYTSGDVCGFAGVTNAELCARWYQLGAWYPFYRSHNANDAPDQYPWSFPQDPYVLKSSIAAINTRYSYLKWYYSVFVREQPHGTVFKPLFFDYPNDWMAIAEAHQALIGSELMIAPALNESVNGVTEYKVFFPGEKSLAWYSVEDGHIQYGQDVATLSVPLNSVVPVFQKAGTIVAQQTQYLEQSIRTRYMDNQFQLNIALDQNNEAAGSLLSIEDYSEGNVKKLCLGGNQDCIVNIQAQIHKVHGKEVIQIIFDPRSRSTNFVGDIIVDSLRIYSQPGGHVVEKSGLNLVFNKSHTYAEVKL